MGTKRKLPLIFADETVPYLPHAATIRNRRSGSNKPDNKRPRITYAGNDTTPGIPTNARNEQERYRIASVALVVQPPNRIAAEYDLRERLGNPQNKTRPTVTDISSTSPVLRRVTRSVTEHVNQNQNEVPSEYGRVFSRRSSKSETLYVVSQDSSVTKLPDNKRPTTLNARNDRTSGITTCTRIHQEGTRIASVVVKPPIRTVAVYDLRERLRNGQNNTRPTIADVSNTSSNLSRVVPRHVNQIQNEPPPHGRVSSRGKSLQSETASVVLQDSSVRQLRNRSSIVGNHFRTEISTSFGSLPYTNYYPTVRHTRSNATKRTEQVDNSLPQSRSSRRSHSLRHSENSALIATLQAAPGTISNLYGTHLSENAEGYESQTEHGNHYSRTRNERNDFWDISKDNIRSIYHISEETDILSIPNTSVSAANKLSGEIAEGYECSICLDTQENSEMRYLECLHKYHKNCIGKWLSENDICPICRFSVEEIDIVSIY